MRLFPDHSVFAPGKVYWDHLDDLDPNAPPLEQESLSGVEDVLAVRYPSGAWLDVSYFARASGNAHFLVAVVAPGDGDRDWEPDVARKCHDFGEVVAAVTTLAPLARDWTA
jgi:hypothetical protein